MKLAVRHSLIVIAFLGLVTGISSVFSLGRLNATASSQRIERARETVAEQLELHRAVATAIGSARSVVPPIRPSIRSGYLGPSESPDSIRPALSQNSQTLLTRSLSGPYKDNLPNVHSVTDLSQSVVAGTLRLDSGDTIWAVYAVQMPPWLQVWRWTAVTLGLAGLLLVIATGHLGVVIQRGAKQLSSSLLSLSGNLRSPIERPSVRELAEVADGIAHLAKELDIAQSEKERLNKQLAERERLASLGRVAAGLAHEVRNPLAAIKLRVDLAAMDSLVPPSVRAELSAVSSEVARLDRLVSDLQVLAGRRVGLMKNTNLRSLAEQRSNALGPWALEKNVKIAVSGEAESLVDPDGLSRVIDNLLKNAIEASPSGQTVELELRFDEHAVLTVRDRGAGVDKGRESELFEPFFTTKPEGMGLGLAISRAIAEAHQGSLRYSRSETTTSFELVLNPTETKQT